jgi:hypothetical protein
MNPINHNFMISLNTSKMNSIQETNPPFNVVHDDDDDDDRVEL